MEQHRLEYLAPLILMAFLALMPKLVDRGTTWRYVGKGECIGWFDLKERVAMRVDCEVMTPKGNEMPRRPGEPWRPGSWGD